MTIDGAINHCEETAKELRTPRAYTDIEGNLRATETCEECAKEHEQLAEWLKELKELRETMEIIKKHYILIEKGVRDNPNDLMIGRAPTVELLNNWGNWVISEIRCPNCLEYFDTDCYSTGELNKCPNCGSKMKGGEE